MNNSGNYVLKKSTVLTHAEVMAKYDALPADIRKVLQDSPYNIRIEPRLAKVFTARTLKNTISSVMRESSIQTYGKNYPL
jgi:hypothetical protein